MAIGNPIQLTNNVASKTISVTATDGQTSFTVTGGYRINAISVFRNGVQLSQSSDFTANDGSTVTLLSAANAGDTLLFRIFDDFRVADAIVSAESDQTIYGNLTVTGTLNGSTIGIQSVGTVVGAAKTLNFVGTGNTFLDNGNGVIDVSIGINTANIISTAITTGTLNVGTGITVNASGINVTGVITATTGSFGGNVSIGGTLTYEDVTNVDSVGVITAQSGIRVGASQSISAVSGTIYYYGDGSNLDGVVSGIEVKSGGTSVGTSLTAINFASGATVTTGSAGITTITIAAGISTTASSPSANTTVTLDLSAAQHHDLTLSAGITTITCTGGSFGESHSVVITQPSSGIATVGFSTYFLFPSGSVPSMSEGSSKVDLVSFVVKQVGAGGTQLLASAGLNYQ